MAKILVIEDEYDIRDEVMNWLQFEGYEVIGAENGRKGLEAIRREKPDLVMCDVSMPEMDGHEVLIELRSDVNYNQLPFVFLTAAADRASVRQGMNLGADDYVTKPFTISEITNVVRARLEKQEHLQVQMEQLSSLIEAEREQRLLKARVVGMFSHDFRNPLASILSSSAILQNYADRLTPERRQQHFQRIDGAVHNLLQMLDEMLMAAEIENGQLRLRPQPINLEEMIERIIEKLRLNDREHHQFVVKSRLPEVVELDARLVQHVLVNLVSNAIKYSPEGSTIHIQAAVQGDQIIVTVQDAGIGIPEEDVAHIFEPFFRASNAQSSKGTGLGLALVKQAIDISGGTIEVTSHLGHGSCFSVFWPF